jgi:hypothetical protein
MGEEDKVESRGGSGRGKGREEGGEDVEAGTERDFESEWWKRRKGFRERKRCGDRGGD